MSLCQGDQELFLSDVSLLTHPLPHAVLGVPVSLCYGLVRSKQEFWGRRTAEVCQQNLHICLI